MAQVCHLYIGTPLSEADKYVCRVEYQKKTILVVESQENIQQFLSEILQRTGYLTILASDGYEALDILKERSNHVHLVLSDYYLPGLSGQELLEKIKADNLSRKIPVIFLTTENDLGKRRAAKDAGLAAWIMKPYKGDYFHSQIEFAIQNAGKVDCTFDGINHLR